MITKFGQYKTSVFAVFVILSLVLNGVAFARIASLSAKVDDLQSELNYAKSDTDAEASLQRVCEAAGQSYDCYMPPRSGRTPYLIGR